MRNMYLNLLFTGLAMLRVIKWYKGRANCTNAQREGLGRAAFSVDFFAQVKLLNSYFIHLRKFEDQHFGMGDLTPLIEGPVKFREGKKVKKSTNFGTY